MYIKNRIMLLAIVALSLMLLYWSVGASNDTIKQKEKNPSKTIVTSIQEHSDETFNEAMDAETENLCATPDRYTDDAWREHMSHHPGTYADCLKPSSN